jgi:hypothetical protein
MLILFVALAAFERHLSIVCTRATAKQPDSCRAGSGPEASRRCKITSTSLISFLHAKYVSESNAKQTDAEHQLAIISIGL